jgi:hypothetical protein
MHRNKTTGNTDYITIGKVVTDVVGRGTMGTEEDGVVLEHCFCFFWNDIFKFMNKK